MLRLLPLLCALLWTTDSSAQTKLLRLSANYWEPYTGPGMPNQGVATEIVIMALAKAADLSKKLG